MSRQYQCPRGYLCSLLSLPAGLKDEGSRSVSAVRLLRDGPRPDVPRAGAHPVQRSQSQEYVHTPRVVARGTWPQGTRGVDVQERRVIQQPERERGGAHSGSDGTQQRQGHWGPSVHRTLAPLPGVRQLVPNPSGILRAPPHPPRGAESAEGLAARTLPRGVAGRLRQRVFPPPGAPAGRSLNTSGAIAPHALELRGAGNFDRLLEGKVILL